MKKTLVTLSVGFLVGVLTTAVVIVAIKSINEGFEKGENQKLCTHINMSQIASALYGYIETNKTTNAVSLETLVHAGRLPEWSAVYVCPEYSEIKLSPDYPDKFWGRDPFSPSSIAGHYSRSPYYIETLSNEFRIRCGYHTNVLNVTVPRKSN